MKKLLLVTDSWEQVNGVSRTLTTLVPLLREEGIEVLVIHPGLFRRLYRFPFYPEIKFAFFPSPRMRKFLREEHPDFVHIATEGSLGVAARKICVKENIKFTTCFHSNYPLYIEYYVPFGKHISFVATAYMRWFHKAASAVMVTTESMRKNLLDSGGYPPLVMWPLGIDTDRFVRSVPPDSFPSFIHPVFVYMGRVAKEKNIEEFLKASLPGSKVVIGDGPQRPGLEQRYGKEAVFVGYKHGQDLVDWLSVGDVCVFPSVTETFGLAMVEALACGLPVAAHNAPGPRDVITPGRDGILSEDIGAAAIACIPLDPEDCRAKALQYSWERSVRIFLERVTAYPTKSP